MLAWTIYISFLGAAALALLPPESRRAARITALLTALAGLAVALGGAVHYDCQCALRRRRGPRECFLDR